MQQTASAALFQHLTVLTEEFSQLGVQLAQAARALQDSGVPPSDSLVEVLTAFRKGFTDLCVRGLTLAESLGVSPLPTPDALISLSDLKSLLQAVAQAEEQKAAAENLRQRTLTVLDRVLAITHRDQVAFPPLLECQARANALRCAVVEARWPDLPTATATLAEEEDPFSNLLAFIAHHEELDDDRWALLQGVVERSFGKPLAVAASRGKLILPNEVTTLADHQQAATVPSAEPLEAVIGSSDSSAVPTEAVTQTIEVQPPTTPEYAVALDELAAQDAATILLPLETEHRQEKEETVQTFYRFGLDDTAQEIATPLLNGTIKERPAALRDLIWRLIFEDKVCLAFHLAGCLETRYPDCQPHLPSWLLRSVALGRYIRHVNGEIARLLKDDFAQFSPACCVTGHREWDQAVGFLLVAAALQPALIAPHTRASAVLQALRLGDELNELAAYCHVIADYGDTLQSLDPSSLKKRKEQAVWQAKADALQQAVEGWWAHAPRLALVYTPATRVWSKWLEPKGLIHALLLPIRQNDPSKLSTAKRAVEQVSSDAQIKREVEHADREVLGRRLGDDITGKALEQLRTYVRETLGLVHRWIELQESRSGQSRGSAQEQGEPLRQEVWSRHGAVLEELGVFKRRHPSLLLLSGLTCCSRALENIHTMFDPESSLPSGEPLPRPLLYADLLRIPSLVLNDQWEIEDADRESLVDGILDLVVNGLTKQTVL